MLNDTARLERLRPPQGVCDAVIDTDIAAEIDDLFALAYAWLSPKIRLHAVYAAPFFDFQYGDSQSPQDGMERSYEKGKEALALLQADVPLYRGSDRFMLAGGDAVASEAAYDLIARANAQPPGVPLYVIAIGCPVNIASALTLDPGIAERIVVLWLAGYASWNRAEEFNLRQNVHASRVLLDSGVPLVMFPCVPVTEGLQTTLAEMRFFLADAAPIGKWLLRETVEYHQKCGGRAVWKKTLWDVAPVAWLINPLWVPTRLCHAPVLTDALLYAQDYSRHLMREGCCVLRDAILTDLFTLLGSPILHKGDSPND